MRIKTALVVALFIAVPVVAQNPRSEDLFIPRAFASDILIPAAGDVPGANGTHFRTDITIVNFRNTEQNLAVYWLPQGRSGAAITPTLIKVNPATGFFSADFVASVLHETGLGSIEIIAIDSSGAEDLQAQIHAAARIWTPEPNVPTGTMSQAFPSVVLTKASYSSQKWIFGVQRSSQYRLNVGVSNTDNERQHFRVTAIPSSAPSEAVSFDLDIAARSMAQVLVPGTSTGTFQIIVINLDDPTNDTTYQAWASSIDQVTGDAWSQIGFPTP